MRNWPHILLNTKVSSNLAFLVPATLALGLGYYAVAALSSSVGAASFLYHSSNERRWRRVDVTLAWLLIASNSVLLIQSNFQQPFASLAVIGVGVALFALYGRRGDDWEWHVSSAAITAFCTLANAYRLPACS